VSTASRKLPGQWINLGAIAVLVVALVYLLFWPGPEGLPLIKIGLPQRTIALDVSIMGINDADLASTFSKGEKIQVSINRAPDLPMTVKATQSIPRTVASTQRDGSVKPQPDPRPEMRFSNNLLLTLEGQGYSNDKGIFIGLKRTRVGATILLHAPDFDAPGSIVKVVAANA
jgi:Domain of unknown function (DUF4330)